MNAIFHELNTAMSPEALVAALPNTPGLIWLQSAAFDHAQARYSFIAAEPFRTFRSWGSRVEMRDASRTTTLFGDPWRMLEALLNQWELLDPIDVPFPLGGCFGYWGYGLARHRHHKLKPRALDDLELPDCHLGFYDSLLAIDHRLPRAWIIATGLGADGTRTRARAQDQFDRWRRRLNCAEARAQTAGLAEASPMPAQEHLETVPLWRSDWTADGYLRAIQRAQDYIRAGDIYQVNLAHRLSAPTHLDARAFYQRLSAASPAPFNAFVDCGEFALCSASPELFLRLSGRQILTRPIKGTRPRGADSIRDTQLAYALQTSPKERAELVMITDLLRNDLGQVCEFGSIQVPALLRLEPFAQVHHLVSTVTGTLRPEETHLSALAACFPGGSITGAPKLRAMQIIEELEPLARGPYTGCLGYLGFNGESQLSMTIRTAIHTGDCLYFHTGAGIVADSEPRLEYEETLHKATGFIAALESAQHLAQPTAPR